jgi:hypothetical protein
MVARRIRDCGELLDFGEVERRLQLGPRTDIGTREIAIDDVIGSVARSHEFDGCFQPRTERLRDVLRQIRVVRPDAANSAILVYQVDHAYFVVDGHKRLALAVEEGRRFIDAEVGRFPSRFHLSRGTTMDEIRATELERQFRETTALAQAVPDARFPLADPDLFLELSESVKAHAYDLSMACGVMVDPVDAARHWHEHVFSAVVAIAKSSGLSRVLSSSTDAELFLVVRRGYLERVDPSTWAIPASFPAHGFENLRRAEPGRLPGAIARLRGQARDVARVLPDADVAVDPAAGADPDGSGPTTIVRRPRREVGPAD